MQKIFENTDAMDKRACRKFRLTHELLMENAARGIADFIRAKVPKGAKILFLCGGGNNGADGYAAARMLQGSYNVNAISVLPPKSELAILQASRARAARVRTVYMIRGAEVFVDCILGSGQKGALSDEIARLISHVNAAKGLKIACDMPTGLCGDTTFRADFTIAMGALKQPLFEDLAKDFTGEIIVADLGLDRETYEDKNNCFLLEREHLKLPVRTNKNSNKGDYGHLVIASGDSIGASILSGLSALTFGAGLVSLLTDKELALAKNPSLMQTRLFPSKTTAFIAGMGLGDTKIDMELFEKYPFVIDADLCYDRRVADIKNKNGVLTPHPKEFTALLKSFGVGLYGVEQAQKARFYLAKKFSQKFGGVLVLKGANTIIAQNGTLYVCALGSSALAKGGSGDVLSGLIGALLAQNYTPLDAAITAVLAHALASRKFDAHNYALTPEGLIEAIKEL